MGCENPACFPNPNTSSMTFQSVALPLISFSPSFLLSFDCYSHFLSLSPSLSLSLSSQFSSRMLHGHEWVEEENIWIMIHLHLGKKHICMYISTKNCRIRRWQQGALLNDYAPRYPSRPAVSIPTRSPDSPYTSDQVMYLNPVISAQL